MGNTSQIVYTGPTLDAVPHFSAVGHTIPVGSTVTIADQMLDVVIKAPAEQVGALRMRVKWPIRLLDSYCSEGWRLDSYRSEG